jgi:hypothetical protein
LSDSAKLEDFEKAAGGQGINLGKRVKKGHITSTILMPFHKKSGKPARTQDNKVIGGSATGDKKSSQIDRCHSPEEVEGVLLLLDISQEVNQKAGQENVGYWKNPDKKGTRE